MEFDPSEQHYQARSESLRIAAGGTGDYQGQGRCGSGGRAGQSRAPESALRRTARSSWMYRKMNWSAPSMPGKMISPWTRPSACSRSWSRTSSRAAHRIRATISLAEEKRNKAKLAMDQAQGNIDKMRVTAPMDGLVALEKNEGAMGGFCCFPGMTLPEYHEGDQVEPGRTVGQVIDPKGMELVAQSWRTRTQQH